MVCPQSQAAEPGLEHRHIHCPCAFSTSVCHAAPILVSTPGCSPCAKCTEREEFKKKMWHAWWGRERRGRWTWVALHDRGDPLALEESRLYTEGVSLFLRSLCRCPYLKKYSHPLPWQPLRSAVRLKAHSFLSRTFIWCANGWLQKSSLLMRPI